MRVHYYEQIKELLEERLERQNGGLVIKAMLMCDVLKVPSDSKQMGSDESCPSLRQRQKEQRLPPKGAVHRCGTFMKANSKSRGTRNGSGAFSRSG